MDALKFAKLIADLTKEKKGYSIKILDLRKVSGGIADYFVICSADSDRQVKAIADDVDEKLIERGIKCFHREGLETLNWVLMDYFDVVLHIFKHEVRAYYNLEKLWGDAPVISIEDDK
ncbi:MAG: iojap-like protein [Ignavibacteria bacterium]|nr:MAG: iojap-like protein [Ignavibacteria bacterium]KAF0161732.1 MAG: iojap-like protein [Ignavibacteria bacterium]